MRRALISFMVMTAAICAALAGAAAAPNDNETRLREALRSATLQMRAMEDERAMLQAKQTESSKEAETLRQRVTELTKQLDESIKKADLEKAVAEFNRRLAEQNETIAKLGETLEKWKAAYNEAANVARTKESERSRLAVQLGGMTKQATTCKEMNAELYKVGTEILDRYAGVGIGDALASREPFIGFKRVELQNLVQDYQDKLLDQKVTQ